MAEHTDAIAYYRGWVGESPPIVDWNEVDAIEDTPRDKSTSYMRELTQVMDHHSPDNVAWLNWGEERKSWNTDEVTQHSLQWATQEQVNRQTELFNAHRERVLNARKAQPTGNESVTHIDQPLKAFLFRGSDVCYGNPNLRITYGDSKSKYTGRCSIRWYTEFNEAGKPYRTYEYIVQCGNRKPVSFRENEYTRKYFDNQLGHWTVVLPHKDRS